MTTTPLTQLLIVEDNPADARLIQEYITEQSWPNIEPDSPAIEHVERLAAARDALTDDIDLVLLDLGLPDSTGVETLDEILSAGALAPVVVMTGLDDEGVGVDAVEHGAQDYLVKDDISPRLLQQTLQYAVRREEQQQELRQRNTELALLNQVVRHDIRNDVAVIVGWGDGLRAHVDEAGQDSLDRMLDACEHITSITETVGDFLSVLEEDDDPELHPVDLDSVLANEIEKARSAYDDATITVTGELQDAPAVMATDLLSSVFRNILNNAVSHNDKAEPEITVSIEADGGTVSVAIADNGPGVPDTQKDEIFGRGEMGLKSSGSGIGLYLVDTLVEMYNGSVVLEDNEPTGSVFTVRLNTVS
ncbi:MAG: signal transduction histidine kinase [Halonotius sp. J07HN6]|jgi:Signal transduction histidine kinase|nr:MAG: signal transduction histidine kinase [Halonotius sp. J07HN6]